MGSPAVATPDCPQKWGGSNTSPSTICEILSLEDISPAKMSTPLVRCPDMPPQLLVSVRNAREAVAAIAGGCDIVDVKEPNRGSLGMADVADIANVVSTVRQARPQAVISAALGETVDWHDCDVPALPDGIDYVKLGLAQLGHDSNWARTYQDVRCSFEESCGRKLAWIAVAYADWQQAQSPPPHEVIAAARDAGCYGVLFDTFTKTGRGLLQWLSVNELRELIHQIHGTGQIVALAGQITTADLPEIDTIGSDIVAVRSAACTAGRRTNTVTAAAVRRFQSALKNSVVTP